MKNKLVIAGVAFVVLLGIAIYALRERQSHDAEPTAEETPELPEIERDAITALEITRPGDEEGQAAQTVTLAQVDGVWRVTAPVEAEADETAISTVLDKLGDLTLTGVVATRPENHARLEVDDASAVKVVVTQSSGEPITLYIGAYRGRNTMLRLEGEESVLGVEGSIKYAFNKELKDWRNRRVIDVDPERVRRVRFESDSGTFEFDREGDGWAPIEGQDPIERFGDTKVQSIVASVARMRAVDFAGEGDDTGLEAPTGTVTLWVAPEGDDEEGDEEGGAPTDEPAEEAGEEADGDEAPSEQVPTPERIGDLETIVARIGGARGDARELFLQREGDPVIYVVSQYLADRMRPDVAQFQNPEPGEEPEEPEMPPGMPGMPGMPGGGGGQQIPPELMQQIQQQLQQQQAGMR